MAYSKIPAVTLGCSSMRMAAKALADDAALAKGLNVHEGKIYYEAVAKAHNL